MKAPDTEATAGVERTPVSPRLSVGLLVFALLLLLFVPIAVRQQSDAIRRTATEIAEPARDLAEDVGRDLAIQVDAARIYSLSHDPVSRIRFEAAGTDGDLALTRLEPLAAELSPGAAARVRELKSSWQAWRAFTGDRMSPNAGPAGDGVALERAFNATIVASGALDTAIGRESARRREEARRIDTVATWVTIALVLIVVGALATLARLSARLRTLADVSRRRALEEVELRRQVQTAMESRARLIRGFSHDIRNPLGAADGYGQLLETGVFGELSERQVESVRRLRRAIGSAVLLTDDLLDLARLEAGQLQVEAAPTDVLAVTREVTDDYRAQAATAGLTLMQELPSEPETIDSDERRIRQILSNLLSNAIKYTPEGGRVTVRFTANRAGSGQWVGVEVADTGPGIPEEQRSRIFDEFSRLEPATARGAGLGLAISSRLARALGGEIALESEPGAGSAFTLWLPRRPA